ncbi:undecaprenyl-phosphate galactose phosphotransferase WbaP [Vibrio gazogenes]|uniref:Undecaprenyl-phosphate galactose phosphotransferase n=1 Tax=Vibrio gazogenes DSM 21264 = NBRC 103151 TaxID=1123492 RepID=A0A1M5D2J7_VIBGA|nr:undecaprenyl-phosphate galactose phosphotransferase WbaP [Vibrio gazogenes]USP13930.1 undecaprenyl-phosphate galactose phosphotransferase WbaP [Vibrio gazogenes]SHF61148.1 undecaprenyl-phosphate galactose phosphotransferase [Vibrio gazogenes DSM 21264] [Vibrio gazogenes DSM 21264 = NBRC 103151]
MEHITSPARELLVKQSHFSMKMKVNKLTLIASDVLSFFTSILLVNVFEKHQIILVQRTGILGWQIATFLLLGVMAILWFWGSKRHYSYRKPFWDELKDVLVTLSVMALVSISISAIFGQNYSVRQWWMTWLFVFILLPSLRYLAKFLLNKANIWKMPCVIIGDAENAKDVLLAIESEPSTGFEVLAVVEPSGEARTDEVFGISYISRADFFQSSNEFHKVFIALEKDQSGLRECWIRELYKRGIRDISIVPALRGVPLYGTDISHFFSHEVMMLRLKNNLPRKSSRFVKRLFDIVGSATLLVLLAPFFLFIAWRVSRDGGSVTYGHERIGLNGKKFNCLKFRSMVMNSQELLDELLATDPAAKAEWDQWFKLKQDPRVTSIGRFLRETSLDELPQLWNVLKGEMSLVGPRPIIDEELQRYGDDADYYLCAKPGVSGLWQVSGRSDTDYKTRVYLDCWYVKNWSLWNDIVILFKTVHVVFRRDGAY